MKETSGGMMKNSINPVKSGVQAEMNSAEIAKPLHLQKLDLSLDVRPFLSEVTKIFESPARYVFAILLNPEMNNVLFLIAQNFL